ncbi:unnamed protein product [Pleuronectes platessa]|uniref:High mobility group protein HMG-I/HMG-Y n=1 Tax=Pleuronectes platessa TaxID=8262 RepID=A0A9N7UGE0_PLEPL|nr:unnamed protein product [Pleuronectes platessa]
MGLKYLWKTERKEVNRVRNGEGRGWHARQAHAEQNIGLIEKSAPPFMPPSKPPFHQTPTPLIVRAEDPGGLGGRRRRWRRRRRRRWGCCRSVGGPFIISPPSGSQLHEGGSLNGPTTPPGWRLFPPTLHRDETHVPFIGLRRNKLLELQPQWVRPSGEGVKSDANMSDKGTVSPKEETGKRGRGRPRKQPQVKPADEPSGSPTPKRPRGRPKGSKNKSSFKGKKATAAATPTTGAKRRGRPSMEVKVEGDESLVVRLTVESCVSPQFKLLIGVTADVTMARASSSMVNIDALFLERS